MTEERSSPALVELLGDPRCRSEAARRRRPHAARALRPARPQPVAQGREPPAHRGVQDPRRVQRGRVARSGRTRPGPDHLFLGEPRAGGRARRPAVRCPCGHRHAVRFARDQARARGGRRRRGRHRRDRLGRAADRRRADRGRARAQRSSRRSTTPRIVAGQGTVGLEIAEDMPGVAAVLVPVGGGGLAAGWRRRSGRWLPARGSSAWSRSWRPMPRASLEAGRIVAWDAAAREPDDRRRDAHAGDRAAQLRAPPPAGST